MNAGYSHDFNDQIGTPTILLFTEQNEDALEKFETEWAGYAHGALPARLKQRVRPHLDRKNASQPN
jgi:hypothetical protein